MTYLSCTSTEDYHGGGYRHDTLNGTKGFPGAMQRRQQNKNPSSALSGLVWGVSLPWGTWAQVNNRGQKKEVLSRTKTPWAISPYHGRGENGGYRRPKRGSQRGTGWGASLYNDHLADQNKNMFGDTRETEHQFRKPELRCSEKKIPNGLTATDAEECLDAVLSEGQRNELQTRGQR